MKTISAIYENGVFRPEGPVDLAPGARVDVTFPETPTTSGRTYTVEELRELFPKSAGVLSQQDHDEMMKAIDEEFGKIEPHEWA